MIPAIIAANILGWPLIHIAVSWLILRIPIRYFARDHFWWATCQLEERFYRNGLGIRRWKSSLPDGAPWLRGFSKKRLEKRDTAYLQAFIFEARRAELAHWMMFLCFPVFLLWNPPWACWVMFAYATAANVPCILAQRYNRQVLTRILASAGSHTESRANLGTILHPTH